MKAMVLSAFGDPGQVHREEVDVHVGDRVVGLAAAGFGTYAEYTVSDTWVELDDHVDFDRAIAVPVAAGTATRVLDQLAVGRDQVLLVNGASGADGSMAVQLAGARGATVIRTAGSASHAAVAAVGAIAVVYGPGLVDRVRCITDRVDAAFDVAGKGALADPVELSGSPDRVITIADGTAGDHGVRFSSGAGFGHDVDNTRAALTLLAQGALTVTIGHRLDLTQAAEAHRISDTGHPGGKIVLHP